MLQPHRLQPVVLLAGIVVSCFSWSSVAGAQAGDTEPAAPAPTAPAPAAPATPVAPASPTPVSPEPAPTPAPTEATAPAMPPASPAPESPAQPSVPADAQPPVAAQPSPPEAPRRALGGPPVNVTNWPPEDFRAAPTTRIYRGFSLRLSAELGYARTDRAVEIGGETQISGFPGGASLDVGATVIDNLIVYGRIGAFAFNHASSSDSPNVGGAYYGLLGAGARYHFMPIDWYGSGTLAMVLMATTSDHGEVENADPGVGLQLETGKTWSSGGDATNVSLGLRFTYAINGSVGSADNDAWLTRALSLVFSVAYN